MVVLVSYEWLNDDKGVEAMLAFNWSSNIDHNIANGFKSNDEVEQKNEKWIEHKIEVTLGITLNP